MNDRYESIKNVFKRDPDTHKLIHGSFSLPEFEYLQNCKWIWTEKVDGMNVRVILNDNADFRGRSDAAHMPSALMKRLRNEFDTEEILEKTSGYGADLCLYGEGAGPGIQRGDKYGPEQFFIMFDAMTTYGWASRRDMLDIAKQFHVMTVPVIFEGTVEAAINTVKHGFMSWFGNFYAEGLVGRPVQELQNQWGGRIIVKIKHRDFYEEGLT